MSGLREIVNKNKGLIIVYIGLGIILTFLNNFSAKYFQSLIDAFADASLTIGHIVVYGTTLIVLCLLNYLDEYPGRRLETSIFLDLKLKALRKISKIDYEVYQTMGTGKLVQRIESGASAGRDILFNYYFCLLRELIPSMLFSMVFIYQMSKPVMYVILAGYVIVFIITKLLLKLLYEMKEHILWNEEKMNHYLVRGFMEMVVFRLNKCFVGELKKATVAKDEIVDARAKMKMIHEAFFAIFAFIVTLIKIGIIAYGWFTGTLTIGAVVGLMTLIDHAYTPIAIFNVLFVQYKLDQTAFDKYEVFLHASEDRQLEQGKCIPTLRGALTLEDVSFEYGERVILEHLDLKIPKGTKIALVGESGSGKSTLIKLVLGLLKPSDGKISVDDYDLSEICLNSYYEHIAYISQDSPIFDGTLKENLVFDKSVCEQDVIEVLDKVHLRELYHKLEQGLDTPLGERGITLSGGEKQRLALARLWFEPKSIIILDEATSAMDHLTEESVMNEVMDLLKEKTVIAIAHRLDTIKDFERIIVCKEGNIMGQGSFDELMLHNTYFKTLYNGSIKA